MVDVQIHAQGRPYGERGGRGAHHQATRGVFGRPGVRMATRRRGLRCVLRAASCRVALPACRPTWGSARVAERQTR